MGLTYLMNTIKKIIDPDLNNLKEENMDMRNRTFLYNTALTRVLILLISKSNKSLQRS